MYTLGERNIYTEGKRSVHIGGVHTLVEHWSAHSRVLWESTKLGERSELLGSTVWACTAVGARKHRLGEHKTERSGAIH